MRSKFLVAVYLLNLSTPFVSGINLIHHIKVKFIDYYVFTVSGDKKSEILVITVTPIIGEMALLTL